jgi:hypothetical protein
VHRFEDRWHYAVAMRSGRSILTAALIDQRLSEDEAKSVVSLELAMSFGVRIGSWQPSERPGSWRANALLIAQPD